MKKLKKLILAVLLFTMSITFVSAKNDIAKLNWDKEMISKADNIEYLGNTKKIAYGEGYVISQINSDETSGNTELIYYNYNGEILKKVTLENKAVLSIKEYDGAIYAYTVQYNENTESSIYEILKLDSNLEVTASNKIENIDSSTMNYVLPLFVNYAGIDYISTVDNKITIVSFLNNNNVYLTHFSKDLENKEIKALRSTDEDIAYGAKYYPIVSEATNIIETLSDSNIPEKITILSESKNNLQVYNGLDLSKCELLDLIESGEEPEELPPCYVNSNLKLTDNNNIVFDKKYEDYILLINARIINDYIVAIGLKNVGNISDIIEKGMEDSNSIDFNIQTDVVILNMDGEIVQTISKTNSHYLEIIPSNKGFTVSKVAVNVPLISIIKGTAEVDANYDLIVESYLLARKIKTNVSGKGFVAVANNGQEGEKVSFKAEPEKGYVLSTIKITDENGNTIEITDETFVMPDTNITIEASFVPKNPETKDIAIMSIAIILLISFGFTCVNYKKIKFLR